MGKSGGFVGLIAGIFGTVAALFTLLVGGAGAALNATGHAQIIGFGWWGVAASFLVIVFGAVAFSNSAIGAFGLFAFSLIGAVLGGSMVAIAMALGVLGGLLAAIHAKKWWPWAGILCGLLVAVPLALSMDDPRKPPATTEAAPTASNEPATPIAQQPVEDEPDPKANAQTKEEEDVVYARCDDDPILKSVKADFLHLVMIEAGADTYARNWKVLADGEQLEPRLKTDTPRLLEYLHIERVASGLTPRTCVATLIFGEHRQLPIQVAYEVLGFSERSGFLTNSKFVMPHTGMAAVNMMQGMQKGILSVMYERELAEINAAIDARQAKPTAQEPAKTEPDTKDGAAKE